MYDALASFYDAIHADLTEDIPFVIAQAQAAGRRVVELGCGTGRLLIPLARHGFHTLGVDNTPAMLAHAQERLRQEPAEVQARVTWLQADMTHFQPPTFTYDLALLGYNTALHLTPAGWVGCLRACAAALRPGGRLLLDVVNPLWLAGLLSDDDYRKERTFRVPTSGRRITQSARTQVDPQQQVVTIDWLYEDGRGAQRRVVLTHRETYHYRLPHELHLLLQEQHFQVRAMWGNYSGAAFAEDTPRLILLAQRPV